jgi:hypothetical protein
MDILDQLRNAVDRLSEEVRNQASNISDSAKEKSMEMIDEWLNIFPKLQSYGMDMSSFAVHLSISPGLDVEMIADRKDFEPEKVRRLLDDNKEVKWLAFVLRTVIMAFDMNDKLDRREPYEKVILKIKVKIPPEVKVILGEPTLY